MLQKDLDCRWVEIDKQMLENKAGLYKQEQTNKSIYLSK
mgnify:CR=1 FL=1